MSKRVGVVLTVGACVLMGTLGVAATASAGEVPASVLSHGHDDSPSASASPSPETSGPSTSPSPSPSEPSATPSEPSATPSVTPPATPSATPSVTPSVTPSARVIITAEQARAIALTASGGGTITKFELKDENSDHPEYRAEIRNGRVEHKIRIDAFTGVITRHDIKS